MTARISILLGLAMLSLLAGACGGGGSSSNSSSAIPTTAIGNSDAETSAVSGDVSDPKNDAYSCALLSKSDIDAAAGSPSQAGTHKRATVLQGEALTTCTVKSVAECPQNLTKDAPYCDKAYQVAWSVDIYPSVNAAQLTFGNDKRSGTSTALTIAGAEEAVYYAADGTIEAREGAGLMRLTYNGPGSLSGNSAVPAKVIAEQQQPAETLAAAVVKKLP